MFIHNLKYTLITLFKSYSLIFWTFAFPLILGTFFNMAFSNIEKSEKLSVINIAIVDNEEFKKDTVLQEAFKTLSNKDSEEQIFDTKYIVESEAKELLNKGEITGYLIIQAKNPKVVVKESSVNETVFQNVVQEITQTKKIVADLSESKIKEEMVNGNFNINYEKIYNDIINIVNSQEGNIKDVSNSNLSYTMIEFYTLIAMTCLYGAMLGMYAINNTLANMSDKGKRVEICPANKMKLILSSICAVFIVQLIGVAILFIYTVFVLNVDYGTRIIPVIILAIVGCFAGLTFGVAVATLIKGSENTKIGIILTFTMLGSFLSGMMGITMKYIIDKNIPLLNKLNPANMITDGFYSLYYYTTLDRYYFNIMSLLIFSGIMIVLAILVLRRQKYDSI